MPTARADRYVKQLAGHWARKTQQTRSGDDTVLTFQTGNVVVLRARAEVLEIEVRVPEDGDVDRFADVVVDHLQRFGRRDEVAVTWV